MEVGGLCSVEPGDRFRQRRALRFRRVGSRFPLERHDDPGGVGGLAFVDRRSPEGGKELPRTVRLLLLDDLLRDQLQALFLSLFQRGQRPCRDGQEREPHVQPSTLRARVGWVGRIGKDLRGHQLVLAAQQGLGRIRHEFLVDRVPLPFGFAQRPERHRHVMAGGAFARVQPGGAFGLQISDGAIDRLLDLLRSLPGESRPVRRQGRAVKGKAPEERREPGCASHGSIPFRRNKDRRQDANPFYAATGSCEIPAIESPARSPFALVRPWSQPSGFVSPWKRFGPFASTTRIQSPNARALHDFPPSGVGGP